VADHIDERISIVQSMNKSINQSKPVDQPSHDKLEKLAFVTKFHQSIDKKNGFYFLAIGLEASDQMIGNTRITQQDSIQHYSILMSLTFANKYIVQTYINPESACKLTKGSTQKMYYCDQQVICVI